MGVPTLAEMIELEPRLYEALRARDSAANRVCELMARGAQTREALHQWQKCKKQERSLTENALSQWYAAK